MVDRYPDAPGYQNTDTSFQAALDLRMPSVGMRELAYDLLRKHELTADEIAARLGVSILSIRPRVTELNKKNLIRDTGKRRKNASGKNAIVWAAD